jgi:predicted GTPase
MTSTNTPRFAVVGHPNKGKSSIVAALAQNDAIDISSRSGTTLRADPFAIATGDAAYTLIDTPGFQRPRRALEWLNRHATSADQRRQAIARFVSSDDCAKQFPDEVALLRPISEGAAILYVVDGSRPYNPDYEAEMEILRWCGQPSMALINPIESGDHIDTWQQALSQFFKVVRVFNPMLADRLRRDEILEAFSVIAPEWRTRIDLVRINYAQQDRRRIADAGQ